MYGGLMILPLSILSTFMKAFIPPFLCVFFLSLHFILLHLFIFASFYSHHLVIVRFSSSHCPVIVQLSSGYHSLSYSIGGLLCKFIRTFFYSIYFESYVNYFTTVFQPIPCITINILMTHTRYVL